MLNPIAHQFPAGQEKAPGAPRAAGPQTSFKTLPPADYGRLKAREKELKNQLDDVQDRRNDLVNQSEGANGVARAGLQSRVEGLDQRLIQIESDLSQVGRDLAATAPASIAVPAPQIIYRGY